MTTSSRSGRRPRLLLVSMYPLDRDDTGPTVRVAAMRDALAELADLDVIAGYRGARSVALGRYASSGRLRRVDGIYVESSTFLPAPTDVAFLGLARALGVPVLTFVRDAYQLFPEYYAASSARRRASQALFRPAFAALMRASTRVAFPSRGLAAVFGRADSAVILPPGSPAPVGVPRQPGASRILYVGAIGLPTLGGPMLLDAMARAREAGSALELTLVCRPGDIDGLSLPPWVSVHHVSGEQIHALLPDVRASVIPRQRSRYNDLAVPIKLMEYLSYGRPLLVTDCTEQARVVEETRSGWAVPATVDGLAGGIGQVVAADETRLDELSEAARQGACANSWRARAEQVLHVLSLDA